MAKTITQPIFVKEGESFKQDALGREDFGISLLKLISISSDELVISLDGEWGEGKTTFVNMWQGLLDNNRIPNIYINAFEHDYSDDAFIAIAGEITAYIEKHEKKNGGISKKLKEFKNKIITVGVKILPWMAKVIIKTLTIGIISNSEIEGIQNIKDDLAKGGSTVADAVIREKLESYKKDLEDINSFKELLSDLSGSINSKQGNQQKSSPLVIIIDELDRCRPTYALDIIEKVKHLFSVKNVVFVLVMNREQLEGSIKSVYGRYIDARTYLQKFINIEITLPKGINRQFDDNDIAKYNKVLFDSYKKEGGLGDENILEFLKVLAEHFNLSLRALEKVYTNLAVFYAMMPHGQPERPSIVSFLAMIKVIEPSVYKKLLHKEISYKELSENAKLPNKVDVSGEMLLVVEHLEGLIVTKAKFKSLDMGHANKVIDLLDGFSVGRQNFIPYFAQQLSMYK